MIVTVVSDASFCPKTKAAGYGGWVVSNRGMSKNSGPLRGATNSGQAETMAVCNVIWRGFKEGLIKNGDRLIVQTDCLTAIKVYEEARWTSEIEGTAFKWLQDTLKKYNLEIEFRHVKGHTGNSDRRSIAQRHCDQRARRAMQKERNKVCLDQCKQLIATYKNSYA